MRDRSDEQLMKAYAGGDMQAFETLYRRHRGALYRYILRLVEDAPTANDLYQGCWEKIIRARERFRPATPFRAWMYRIAHNHVMDYFRRKHPTVDLPERDLAASDPGPDDHLQSTGRQAALAAAIGMLPEDQKDTLLLKLEVGLDLKTIAKVTGVNRETAKSRLRYAVKKLNLALGEATAVSDDERSE